MTDTDDKLPDDNTFENVVIIKTCVIKDDCKVHSQIFWEKYCLLNKHDIQ